jgi:hypothetical protein
VHPDTEPADPIPGPDVFTDLAALRKPPTLRTSYEVQSLVVRIADYHLTPTDDGLCLGCDDHDFHAVRKFRAGDREARRDALHVLLQQLVTRVIVDDEREAAGLGPIFYPDEDEEHDDD